MFEKLEITRMAQALAAHSGARLATIAQNVANADTPQYRAMDLPEFSKVYEGKGGLQMRATRPGHLIGAERLSSVQPIQSGGAMAPNGNDVSLDLQMMKSIETRQNHEMALAVYRTTSAIIRTSLGRNG